MIPVLTIDGPSGVGKGTIAYIMAQKLHWNLLDSGAIYRAFAVAVSNRDIEIDNVEELLKLASNLDLKFQSEPDQNNLNIDLDNVEISAELRTEKTAELASKYAMIGPLREPIMA